MANRRQVRLKPDRTEEALTGQGGFGLRGISERDEAPETGRTSPAGPRKQPGIFSGRLCAEPDHASDPGEDRRCRSCGKGNGKRSSGAVGSDLHDLQKKSLKNRPSGLDPILNRHSG